MSCAETDERVFDIVRKNVEDIVLVSDDAMREAARWLWFELGIAADLSGAAAIAALRSRVVSVEEGVGLGALVCGAGADVISG